MNEYDFTQTIYTPQLLDEIATAGLPAPTEIVTNGSSVQIFYSTALSSDQATTLGSVVANHVANPAYVTLAVQAQVSTLIAYLNSTVTGVATIARAAMITALAPKLPLATLVAINTAIASAASGSTG